ncbi:MAG: methyltransferase domain-containing protein [Actinomycetota bacterium]|nr:methyltransferase domain-containing protein [Actinomycetota bacterium]
MSAHPSTAGTVVAEESTEADPVYLFDPRDEERRLVAQARLFDPLTERLFREAGVTSGMRVLDLGSGVGDTAMLAARLVGPDGSVLGVDLSSERLAVARSRACDAGLENVEFVQGDLLSLDLGDREFDAIVGRLILMYLPDPVAILRSAARRVRPGGLVCFHEVEATFDPAYPPSPAWEQARRWFLETVARAHVEPRMGLKLFPAFVAAGLPEPALRLEAAIGGGRQAPAFAWADVFKGMVSLMEELGVATASEVDPATLEDRLLADVRAHGGVVVGPLLVGAWTHTCV